MKKGKVIAISQYYLEYGGYMINDMYWIRRSCWNAVQKHSFLDMLRYHCWLISNRLSYVKWKIDSLCWRLRCHRLQNFIEKNHILNKEDYKNENI